MKQDGVNLFQKNIEHQFILLFLNSSSAPQRKQLLKTKNKNSHLINAGFLFFFPANWWIFNTVQAVCILGRTTHSASFFSEIQWGHAGQQLRDYSCSPPWNTLRNNDNSDGREQTGHWLDTKATLTGRTKLSISSCIIVSLSQNADCRGKWNVGAKFPSARVRCMRCWNLNFHLVLLLF